MSELRFITTGSSQVMQRFLHRYQTTHIRGKQILHLESVAYDISVHCLIFVGNLNILVYGFQPPYETTIIHHICLTVLLKSFWVIFTNTLCGNFWSLILNNIICSIVH
jgi:hypothetical protein